MTKLDKIFEWLLERIDEDYILILRNADETGFVFYRFDKGNKAKYQEANEIMECVYGKRANKNMYKQKEDIYEILAELCDYEGVIFRNRAKLNAQEVLSKN
jgi:hypothetical protein